MLFPKQLTPEYNYIFIKSKLPLFFMSLILASIFDGNIKTKNEEEKGGRKRGWVVVRMSR